MFDRRHILRVASLACLPAPAMASTVVTTRAASGGIASDLVGACEREAHRAPPDATISWRCPICGCPGRGAEPGR